MTVQNAFKSWELHKSDSPLIIAGPCSAESEQQVMNTARELQNTQVNLFRAGIWKPRTRPDSFQGVGHIGLKWLQQVQQEFGIQAITEVANTEHIEQVLKHDIRNIWIGARTTTNPFAMQEIANAIKGVDVSVFVKNPINPDCELWIGAIERIQNAGIKRVAAIHRGFSTFNKTQYRNVPQWQIPIELRQQMPDIPMICDPSHIAGHTKPLQEISQKAYDLNFNGLIIETHINPKEAWSDAQQQITPQELKSLLNSLVIRKKNAENNHIKHCLEDLRHKIDYLDDELIGILEQRMQIIEKIAEHKKDNNISVLQSDRWKNLLDQMIDAGSKKGISKECITNVFKAIHQESINKQTKIINNY